jgi:hypothetical protein
MRINLQTGNIFLTKLLINFKIYTNNLNSFFIIFLHKFMLKKRNKNTSQAMLENKSVKSIQMIKHLYNNIIFSFLKKVSL